MTDSYLSRMLVGASAAAKGISTVYKDTEVRKTYRVIVLGLLAVSLFFNLSGGYAVWHFTQAQSDSSSWQVWGLLFLRFLGWFAVLLISPLVAITTCNLLFPVFSEIPFFAGLLSLNPERGAALKKRAGLGTRAAILNSVRRFGAFGLVSVGIFLLGLVPAVGPLVAPPLQLYFTARTVGWEMMDPYFDRLGLSSTDQKVIVRQYSAEILGMGLLCSPLLAIPLFGPLLFGLVQAGSANFVLAVFPSSDCAEDLLASRA